MLLCKHQRIITRVVWGFRISKAGTISYLLKLKKLGHMLRDKALIWQCSLRSWNYYHWHFDIHASPHIPHRSCAWLLTWEAMAFCSVSCSPLSVPLFSDFSNCSPRKQCMTESLARSPIYFLPFSGRVDEKLQLIAESHSLEHSRGLT